MIVYAESSALLAWLFGEPGASAVPRILENSDAVIVSELTLLECERAVIRGLGLKELNRAEAERIRARLREASEIWNVWRFSRDILQRAAQPFPSEPLRTLDALHLAWALAVRSELPSVAILSLDERIRNAARPLGFQVYPG